MAADVYVILIGYPADAKCFIGNILLRAPKPQFRTAQFTRNIVKSVANMHDTVSGRKLNVVVTPSPLSTKWEEACSSLNSRHPKVLLYVTEGGNVSGMDSEVIHKIRDLFKFPRKPETVVVAKINGQSHDCCTVAENIQTICFGKPILISNANKEARNMILFRITDILNKTSPLIPPKTKPRDEIGPSEARPGKQDETIRVYETQQPTTTGTRPKTAHLPLRDLTHTDWATFYDTGSDAETAESQHVRVMVVGAKGAGKTTLVHRLQGINMSASEGPTEGLDIHTMTSKCLITDDAFEWEHDLSGFGEELHLQRMSVAFKEKCDKKAEAEYEDDFEIDTDSSDQENSHTLLESPSPSYTDDQQMSETNEMVEDQWSVSQYYPREVYCNAYEDPKTDYLRKIVRKAEHSSGERAYVSYWDFSGDDIYQSMNQVFLSPFAVFMIVFDLSMLDGSLSASYDSLLYTVESIKAFALNGNPPPFVLVGTHCDKFPSEQLEVRMQQVYVHLGGKCFPFVAIDNTLDVDKDTNLDRLRQSILENADCIIHEQIPVRWIQLDHALLQGKYTDGSMTLEQLCEIDKTNVNPLENMERLEYVYNKHCRGDIIYFNTPKCENVILLRPLMLVKFLRTVLKRAKSYGITSQFPKENTLLCAGKIDLTVCAEYEIMANKLYLENFLTEMHIVYKM